MTLKSAPDVRPPLQLAGFAVLLAALFAAAFFTGRLAGPVGPGMHRVAPGAADSAPPDQGSHGMTGMDMP
ncbi:hypothetical protein F8568_036965 [Actinomadura sp. LD22]|uniref:Uncharacterized protein n=1 Tax=Actinomadura physcomitrii TaxID=2650748 RepID=A0A6I4MJL5_9ACTN|nr:hypothetical protein [Actinomadura physcomitrii]MWA05853.1 hypothetical protein [Actinomadura physcomitrii]